MKNNKIVDVLMSLFIGTAILLTTGSCARTASIDEDTSVKAKASTLSITLKDSTKAESAITSTDGNISTTSTDSLSSTALETEALTIGTRSKTVATTRNVGNKTTTNKVVKSTTVKKPTTTKKTPTTTKKTVTAQKLTKNNINDIEVFNKYSAKILEEVSGSLGGSWTYSYNDIFYKINVFSGQTCGEFQMMFAILNLDYINDNTLKEVFGKYSLEDLKKFSNFVKVMPVAIEVDGSLNNWDQVTIDADKANQLKNIELSYHNYIANKDKNSFEKLINSADSIDNAFIKSYLTYCGMNLLFKSEYSSDLISKVTELLDSAPLELEQIATDIYNKSR